MNPFHNRPDEWRLYDPLVGESMLELGNKKNGAFTYKAYFESLGIRHVSVDWNGQDGALKLDLREPLWDELGQFDMVSNIGTSEHVDPQNGVWANIHHCTAVGGVYVGLTPYPDGRNWWWHGDWYPTEKFYEEFAALNGWQIERLYKDRTEPFCNLMCRMRRVDEYEFHMPYGNIRHNKRTGRFNTPAGCVPVAQ